MYTIAQYSVYGKNTLFNRVIITAIQCPLRCNFTPHNNCSMKTLSPIFGTRLTNREKEVLTYITEGWKTSQIAVKLSISENTVANHRKNVIRKKGVRTLKQLVKGSV